MLRLILPLCVFVTACGPSLPDLDARLSAEARAADFPELRPLAPLLQQADALTPRNAETSGLTLEARAADLRRRAAILRRMPL